MKQPKLKHCVRENTAYVLKVTWEIRRVLIPICLTAVAATMLTPLVTMYLPRTVLAQLEAGTPISVLVLTILGFTGLLTLLRIVKVWAESMMERDGMMIRLERTQVNNQKAFTCDYEWFDTADFVAGQEKARDTVRNGNSSFQAIYPCLVKLCAGAFGFLAYLGILLRVGWWIAPVTAACTVFTALIRMRSNRLRESGREQFWQYYKRSDYITTRAMDAKAAKDIRLFGIASWFRDLFEAQLRLFDDWNSGMEQGLLMADLLDCGMTIVREGIAYGVLISMVLGRSITVPDFVLYFAAVGGFSTWVSDVMSAYTELDRHCLDIGSYRRQVEHPNRYLHGEGLDAQTLMDEPLEIRLDHVSYRYPGGETDSLRDVNLTIHPGEKLAVVGLNGAGKTTLVKLICGLLDPTEGTVYLNGTDLRTFDRDSIYALFSVVFQDFCILPMTIAENIAQGQADRDRVKNCLRQADLLPKVETLPDGIDSRMCRDVYEDAVEFSGGETQRLMLARAIYKQAPAVLLDEPTAALDPIAEHQMYLRYRDLTAGRTSVYISHRLASTRFCDRVIYLEDGVIREEGTHDSLMNARGEYYRLFEIQSQYYREGKEETP